VGECWESQAKPSQVKILFFEEKAGEEVFDLSCGRSKLPALALEKFLHRFLQRLLSLKQKKF
jgi:hypothetical protein